MSNKTGTTEYMHTYWMKYTEDLSLNTMFCDDRAEVLAALDTQELLTLIPSIENLDILELGAGIGRFTGELAKKAKSVIAVDFIEKFSRINESANSHFGNTKFICADATKLQLPQKSVDMIFTSWLFEYVDNDLLLPTFTQYLGFLREGGYMFLRESCFHPSGTLPRSENPTIYRKPVEYSAVLRSAVETSEDGQLYGFEVVFSRSVQSYVKVRENYNNICWLVKKVRISEKKETSDEAETDSCSQRRLDSHHYSMRQLAKLEYLKSAEDLSKYARLCSRARVLQSGTRCQVLEVGSGLGDGAFYISENFDATVTGVDLSCNMVGLAQEARLKRANKRVQFEVGDILHRHFPAESFDLIVCVDVLVHIPKQRQDQLISNFQRWLKPDGELLVGNQFAAAADADANSYRSLLSRVGFVEVQVDDLTSLFADIARGSSARIASRRNEFVEKFSEADYNEVSADCAEKVALCDAGKLQWLTFYARNQAVENRQDGA